MFLSRHPKSNFAFFRSLLTPQNREERLRELDNLSKEIDQITNNIAQQYNLDSPKTITEKDLIYHLYLNPIGYIDDPEDKDKIMQSPIADKYFRMGIITKGVNVQMEQQYRLTDFGRSQIKNAIDLEILS
jgi:hypothetical protein